MNDSNPTPAQIAALAQKIWEEEGQPEGKAEDHWRRAEEQLRYWQATGGVLSEARDTPG